MGMAGAGGARPGLATAALPARDHDDDYRDVEDDHDDGDDW